MKKFFRKAGRWLVILYAVQALVGIGAGVYVGAYLVVTLDPAEIERMVSCVAS